MGKRQRIIEKFSGKQIGNNFKTEIGKQVPGRLLTSLFIAIFLLTVLILCFDAWYTWRSYKFLRVRDIRNFNVTEPISDIRYYDEVLTMSARMAACRGDLKWIERYNVYEPRLIVSINKARDLIVAECGQKALDEVEAANTRLVEMERQALSMVEESDYQAAEELLGSSEYLTQKQIYFDGFMKIYNDIVAGEEQRLDEEQFVALVTIDLMGGAIVLIVFAWVFVMWVLRKYITERRQSEYKLFHERNLLRTLIDNIPDYIYVKDVDKKFVIANESTAELMGAETAEDILGKTDFDFYSKERADEYSSDEDEVLKNHKALINKVESARAPDGKRRWFLTNKIPLYDMNKNLIGLVGVGRDFTNRKKAEDERAELVKTLSLKNKDLESIIYITSHDLRSSLVNIQGFSSELEISCNLLKSELEKAGLSEKIEKKVKCVLYEQAPEALGFIKTGASRIDALLKGLLRLSRLGRAAVTFNLLNMNQMVRNIIDSMEYQIKEVEIEVTIDDLPGCLGETSQINQVFSNLIDNAVKYIDNSKRSEIHISGRVEDGRSVYCVMDNGIGIAGDYQDKIFEIFHRLDTESIEGEGLGLTIVRRILERHGGDIWLESEPGKGSSFFVALKNAD